MVLVLNGLDLAALERKFAPQALTISSDRCASFIGFESTYI
jgi:hypothetical protein